MSEAERPAPLSERFPHQPAESTSGTAARALIPDQPTPPGPPAAESSPRTSSLNRWRRSVLVPGVVVFLVYGAWLAGVVGSGHDVRDFIRMGHRFVFVPHVKPLFRPDPHYQYTVSNDGYDGQFAYYIALDPVAARGHLDRANYRYTRILYPLLARLLSGGQANLIPYTLIVINWIAIALGTLFLALWLRLRRISSWFALIYGFSPGLFICLQRDLEEPLAFGLIILALYLHLRLGRYASILSGFVFALAALTRESTAVFPVLLALWLLVGRAHNDGALAWPKRVMQAVCVAAPTVVLFGLYKFFLLRWLGSQSAMVPAALAPRFIPFSGLASYWPWHVYQVEVIVGVVAPALIWIGMCLYAPLKRQFPVEIGFLLLNVMLFVVLLNRLSYGNIFAVGRVATGAIIGAILCIPVLDRVTAGNRAWLSFSAALWLAPWALLVPFSDRVPSIYTLLLEMGAVLVIWGATEDAVLARRMTTFEASRR